MKDGWYTPTQYVDLAREVMGGIDTEPMPDELALPWRGRVFFNLPGQRMAGVEKMVASWISGDMAQGIMLVPTEMSAIWFQLAQRHCTLFCNILGRIPYIRVIDGEAMELRSPTRGSIFFYYGENLDAFAGVFKKIGHISRVIGSPSGGICERIP